MPLAGYPIPLLVEPHEYRPTKVEGNPQHPGSMGATDIFAQASILNLYDPDRSTTVTHMGEPATWSDFLRAMRRYLETNKGLQGGGVRFLTGSTTSPTFAAQMKAISQQLPQARRHRHDPVPPDTPTTPSNPPLPDNNHPLS